MTSVLPNSQFKSTLDQVLGVGRSTSKLPEQVLQACKPPKLQFKEEVEKFLRSSPAKPDLMTSMMQS